MTRAVIPGTYDPITLGHLDIIERATHVFSSVVVGVADSPNKRSGPLFTLAERIELAQDAVSHLANVEVMAFDKLLVDFACQVEADAIVKGLRAVTDFDSEFQQSSINYRLNPKLETIFIMANPRYMFLSSSMVKEIASMHGDISHWVTPLVQSELSKRLDS